MVTYWTLFAGALFGQNSPGLAGRPKEEPRSTEPLVQRSSGWCWAARHTDTAGGRAEMVSLASPSPSHTPHTKPLAKRRTDASRQGSLPPAKRAGPSCFNQQSPERLSSLLLRMCPVRPAWDLESHRALPTHRPLLLSVQWKPRAWDSWTLVSGQGATKTAPCRWLRTTGTGGPGTSVSTAVCLRKAGCMVAPARGARGQGRVRTLDTGQEGRLLVTESRGLRGSRSIPSARQAIQDKGGHRRAAHLT